MSKLLFLCLFGVAFAATTTTHRPHHTHEPSENDSYKFVYESHSHTLVVVDGHVCYTYTPSDSERTAVHTDTGLRTLELKVLSLIFGGNYKTTTKDALNQRVQHSCGSKSNTFMVVNAM